MSILLPSCNSDEHAEQGFSILNAEAIVPGMPKQRNIHNIYNHLLTNYSRNLVFPPKLKKSIKLRWHYVSSWRSNVLCIVTYALSQLSHKGKEFIFHNLSLTVVSMSEPINQECIQLYRCWLRLNTKNVED